MDFFSDFGGIQLVWIHELPSLGIVWGSRIYSLADIIDGDIIEQVVYIINTLVFVQLFAWGYEVVEDVIDKINNTFVGGGYLRR